MIEDVNDGLMIACESCSIAGGTGGAVEHLPPACAPYPKIAKPKLPDIANTAEEIKQIVAWQKEYPNESSAYWSVQGFFMCRSRQLEESLAQLLAAQARITQLTKLLSVTDDFRRAYQDGKYKLYAMGGEICDAAAENLPCGEGPLDRAVRKEIGTPQIRAEVVRAEVAEVKLKKMRS